MKITKWYKLSKAARKAGGDKYVVMSGNNEKTDPVAPTDVLYIAQIYSRGFGPGIAQAICVTFDFGKEEEGL